MCPSDPKKTLGIKLYFLTIIVKNVILFIKYILFLLFIQLKKYFTFEIQILDDKNIKRRFRASNYQIQTRIKPMICTFPMKLEEGWNQIQLNLSDLTKK